MSTRDELGLSPEFLKVAACPACHSDFAVDYEAKELLCVNNECALAYPVKDSIPVLLVDQARRTRTDDTESEK